MDLRPMTPRVIAAAHARIAPYVHRTPLLQSHLLNKWLGHQVIFKAECLQKTGAFKARGALNALLALKEQEKLPEEVVAFSSGNHAQAVAMAAGILGIKATIFIPKEASSIKRQATKDYGALVVEVESRKEAEARVAELKDKGKYLIHPYDNNDIIAGQGTACYEALQDLEERPDAIFVPCGGGGLSSGTWLAAQLLLPSAQVFATEPLVANDAARSFKTGTIQKISATPPTIADGVRTLSVSERTFHYIKNLAGFFEIEEEEICYWNEWLMHLLKVNCEPTSALAMAGAYRWLQQQKKNKKVLVILSGGNVAPETLKKVWAENYLTHLPTESAIPGLWKQKKI